MVYGKTPFMTMCGNDETVRSTWGEGRGCSWSRRLAGSSFAVCRLPACCTSREHADGGLTALSVTDLPVEVHQVQAPPPGSPRTLACSASVILVALCSRYIFAGCSQCTFTVFLRCNFTLRVVRTSPTSPPAPSRGWPSCSPTPRPGGSRPRRRGCRASRWGPWGTPRPSPRARTARCGCCTGGQNKIMVAQGCFPVCLPACPGCPVSDDKPGMLNSDGGGTVFPHWARW